jgi:hypothetical protein
LLYEPRHRETVERHIRQAFAQHGVGVTIKHTSFQEKDHERNKETGLGRLSGLWGGTY